MEFEKHPINALHEYCHQHTLPSPMFSDVLRKGKPREPEFVAAVKVNEKIYGPSSGSTKAEAKAKVAILACDDLEIYHTGLARKRPQLKVPAVQSLISRLHEYCQLKQYSKPKEVLVKEQGLSHDKLFTFQYRVAEKTFPIATGPSKDVAKRRAAARALAELEKKQMREYIRGTRPDEFGNQVAEYAWEAFGILCEELGHDVKFCLRSELACFLLENHVNGELKVVSIGTGTKGQAPQVNLNETELCHRNVTIVITGFVPSGTSLSNDVATAMVCPENWRATNGETIIDCHAIVIARRGLLIFLFEQLAKLLQDEDSIFEYFSSPTIARLKSCYELHFYTKSMPCGNARKCELYRTEADYLDVNDNHGKFFDTKDTKIMVECKGDKKDVVSCSAKLLLWNTVGIQGALLSNFIPPLFISSITVSLDYVAKDLVRAICCRAQGLQVNHPWCQHGTVEGMEQETDEPATEVPSTTNNETRYTSTETPITTGATTYANNGTTVVESATMTGSIATIRSGETTAFCATNIASTGDMNSYNNTFGVNQAPSNVNNVFAGVEYGVMNNSSFNDYFWNAGVNNVYTEADTLPGFSESMGVNDGVANVANVGSEVMFDGSVEWSIYWTQAGKDLMDELECMPNHGGIIDTNTGTHLVGTEREGEIPIICKRNIYRKYRTLCQATSVRCDEKTSYLDLKNRAINYKLEKNKFFQKLDETNLGFFPIMDRQVDTFWLRPEDTKDVSTE